jgi:pimeloyl-ACP methyl ester carboxylesterase
LGRTQDESHILAAGASLPILAVQGTEDALVSHDNNKKFLEEKFPDALEWHSLDGIGHSVFYEAPEITNGLILKFVRRVTGSF